MRLQPVPQWYFADPAGEGVFYLNPTAAAGAGDLYELPPGQYICRTVKRPVDLVALGACVIKYNGEQGWQSFLDIFGNPAIFFEYPPGTSDERAREYDAMAKNLIGDGRGGFPSGGKFTTIDTQAKGGESFQQITDWANKKIVRKALAGELTLLAESGTGTLAGGAHSEGFKSLATGDCRSIAECIQGQYLDRLLDRQFPGMPHLVEFVLEYPETRDLSIETAAIATLAGAGFVADEEQVAERTGYNCTYQQPQQGMPLTIDNLPLTNRNNGAPAERENSQIASCPPHGHSPLRGKQASPVWPNCLTAVGSFVNRKSYIVNTNEPPLTEAELEAFKGLAKPNKERMEQRQKEVETALRRAADLPEDGGQDYAGTYSEAIARAVGASGIGIEDLQEAGALQRNREYKRDSNGRFASTGAAAHSHKGGRGSQGNPKAATTKSNTPLKAAPGAKKQKQVDATEHALKAKESGGGVVEGAAWIKGKRLDVKGGSPDTGGASHMTKHYKPGDTSRREAARDTHLGKKQPDRTEVASVGKRNKVILADKGDHYDIITTRRKNEHD